MQSRCTTAGQAKTEYDRIKVWVDSHRWDTISTIPLNASYRDTDNADNNMTIHLLRTSLVYKVSAEVSYGQRVADLLYWLSQNGTGLWTTTAGTGDGYGIVYPALAMASDWCYDQMDYAGHKTSIISYLDAIVQSAIDQPIMRQGWSPGYDNLYVGYKTEEVWYPTFLAIAVYGESGINASAASTAIERFRYFMRDYSGRWDESGFEGGLPFGGSYAYGQLIWHRTAFFELWESGCTKACGQAQIPCTRTVKMTDLTTPDITVDGKCSR